VQNEKCDSKSKIEGDEFIPSPLWGEGWVRGIMNKAQSTKYKVQNENCNSKFKIQKQNSFDL